jgi:nitroimidazol reductase NimA-like FMN-containing flavoprotein (pyridoxamine 5'-phosphate oxidase superfamily)
MAKRNPAKSRQKAARKPGVASDLPSVRSASSTSEPKAGRPFAPGYGIADAGDGLLPWSWVSKKMGACHTFWLATIDSRGPRPHVMPLWGVWVDDAFYFSTGKKSRKGENLAANSACTVTNDDGKEAVIIEGTASTVEDSAALERMAAAYQKKYKMDPRSVNEPITVVRPKKIFAFIEKSFPKTATRWVL